jgi:hypothetical protein
VLPCSQGGLEINPDGGDSAIYSEGLALLVLVCCTVAAPALDGAPVLSWAASGGIRRHQEWHDIGASELQQQRAQGICSGAIRLTAAFHPKTGAQEHDHGTSGSMRWEQMHQDRQLVHASLSAVLHCDLTFTAGKFEI